MEFTRGDNKGYFFKRQTKEGVTITEPVSEMYLTVKKNYHEPSFLIQKKLSSGDITFEPNTGYYKFEFVPSDTDQLEYDTYVYDIQIQYLENEVLKTKTLIVDKLKLTEEVTFSSNQ